VGTEDETVMAFDADLSRSETDPIDKKTVVWKGRARFMRPDRATLYLVKSTDPKIMNTM